MILALWTLPLNHAPAIGRLLAAGVEWGMSNRDTQPTTVPLWVGRADRAQRNHLDNLPMIAAIILIAQVAGQADVMTGYAALAVLGFRIAHSVFYWIGIPLARSGAYVGSVLALGVLVWRIVT